MTNAAGESALDVAQEPCVQVRLTAARDLCLLPEARGPPAASYCEALDTVADSPMQVSSRDSDEWPSERKARGLAVSSPRGLAQPADPGGPAGVRESVQPSLSSPAVRVAREEDAPGLQPIEDVGARPAGFARHVESDAFAKAPSKSSVRKVHIDEILLEDGAARRRPPC